ncbi:hypothetical protein HYH03_007076 [Edaphochlamys debaryana]|uniref:Uncharacterized protein n=1 Tax=Edaphochlamys debaryana TaxID=47281 RepID=A0A835Y2P0_9CHLO|nr:hypothetical protein HYH03_007076 [Edaphochlamys debaryana]|eukprot:KAG2494836.1 hypothetical protein HYH03_007076 [Edaphochlamys debaryana]
MGGACWGLTGLPRGRQPTGILLSADLQPGERPSGNAAGAAAAALSAMRPHTWGGPAAVRLYGTGTLQPDRCPPDSERAARADGSLAAGAEGRSAWRRATALRARPRAWTSPCGQ